MLFTGTFSFRFAKLQLQMVSVLDFVIVISCLWSFIGHVVILADSRSMLFMVVYESGGQEHPGNPFKQVNLIPFLPGTTAD